MPKKPALRTAKAAFVKSLDSAENLFAAVSPYLQRNYDSISTNPLHAEQARRVVALAFLAAVSAWEEFIEFALTRYLAGAQSPGGLKAKPRAGYADSVAHAFELISGELGFDPERNFLSWTPGETLRRARIYFVGGEPFFSALAQYRERLDDFFAVRNRVAHSSTKARQAFKTVAMKLDPKSASKLRQGFSVGEFLVSPAVKGFPEAGGQGVSVFSASMAVLRHLADRIVP